ncbi:MAG: four helix bundle protein [Candidatus Omnitrophica bacterium]|nr:four helix bundle protein [Candidatus Omnitrophota bacterium]
MKSIKERAYDFSVRVVRFLDTLAKDTSTQIISKQLLRSATSIAANIVEAQSGCSKRDFANFLSHALKSSNETVYWLCLLGDAKSVKSFELTYLVNESKEIRIF